MTSENFYTSTFEFLWRQTLSVYEDEAKLISAMAFRVTKLEKWLALSKRTMENEKELDDMAWKRVCEAARVEMRLEMRYMQTKQNGFACSEQLRHGDGGNGVAEHEVARPH